MAITLNAEQTQALAAIEAFLAAGDRDAFILRGSAGTGKTTLIASLVEALARTHRSCAFLAPTGRAARILGAKLKERSGQGHVACKTIHSHIYLLSGLEVNEEAEAPGDPGLRWHFPLKQEEPTVSLLVVDEASLVGDRLTSSDLVRFGSGRLLQDLIHYARLPRPSHARRTRILFVGDPAQLPPVGENESPALSAEYLARVHHLRTDSFELRQVVRQAEGSPILQGATALRDRLSAGQFNSFSLDPAPAAIAHVDSATAIGHLVREIRSQGSSIAVVPSNAIALDYNRTVRGHLWGDERQPVQVDDLLLVNRNSTQHPFDNGDLVRVVSVESATERVLVPLRGTEPVELGFRHLVVALNGAGPDTPEVPVTILENLLDSPERELSAVENRALIAHFRTRYPDLKPRTTEFRMKLFEDPYFNALQVKFGYALTCHKAQGGEWRSVIVHFKTQGGLQNSDFFRWAYTAITRSREQLFLVNPPRFTATSGLQFEVRKPVAALAGGDAGAVAGSGLDGAEARADPDRARLAFPDALVDLLPIHVALREAWLAAGIQVESLRHLDYAQRYVLVREGRTVTVEYFHDRKFRMTRHRAMPAAGSDPDLERDALAVMATVQQSHGKTTGTTASAAPDPSGAIDELLGRIDLALTGSGISRGNVTHLPYRLRLTFTDGTRKTEVDFTHDRLMRWKTVTEVGSRERSQGLYDTWRALVAPILEA